MDNPASPSDRRPSLLHGGTHLFPYAVIFMLALAGAVLSGYLAYAHILERDIPCPAVPGEQSGCDAVNQSIYAEIFGIPVALIGVAGYLAIALVCIVALGVFPFASRFASGIMEIPDLLFALCASGFLFTLYLNYLQLFVILRICFFCEISASLITLMTVISAVIYRQEKKHMRAKEGSGGKSSRCGSRGCRRPSRGA